MELKTKLLELIAIYANVFKYHTKSVIKEYIDNKYTNDALLALLYFECVLDHDSEIFNQLEVKMDEKYDINVHDACTSTHEVWSDEKLVSELEAYLKGYEHA